MKKKSKLSIQIKAFLMRCLCYKRREPINLDDVKSILILRYDRIGDMVVTTPLFRALRKRFPEAKISVLASQSNAKIVENNPNVDEVYVFPASLIKRLLILAKLRAQRFSLLVDLEHNLIWHIIFHIRLINPKWVVSSFKCDRYGVDADVLPLYDMMAETAPDNHMVEVYLGIPKVLGVSRLETDDRYQLFLSAKNLNHAQHYLDDESFIVGFNFFGSKSGWAIAEEDFYRLCKEVFSSRSKAKLLVFTTKETLDKVEAIVAKANFPSCHIVTPTNDVMDAAALISKLDLLVTPDTSFTHIACTFDIPLVTINPKSAEVFRNWKPIHPSNRAKVIFSKSEKSLAGYSYDELKEAVSSFLPNV